MALTSCYSYLTKHLKNIEEVVADLREDGILSANEEQEILMPFHTDMKKRSELLRKIEAHDWDLIGVKCLEIFRKTGNKDCADKIEEKYPGTDVLDGLPDVPTNIIEKRLNKLKEKSIQY